MQRARAMLRRQEFEGWARNLGLATKRQQADAIGVHESIHGRVLDGQRPVSGPYVIGVLMLVGDDALREQIKSLFEVEDAA
jgi:hypothetical protein